MPLVSGRQIDPDSNGGGPAPGEESDPRLNWSVILDAPEIGSFLKTAETPRAKEYREKVSSVLNAVLQARLSDPNGLADVSAILQRGPVTALRAGALADDNEGFRKGLDMLTAPDNPAVLFAVAAVPLIMQLFRNHEGEIQEARTMRAAKKTMTRDEKKAAKAAKPRVEFKLLGRTFKLPFAVKFNLSSALRMRTVDPDYLVSSVIGDPKIRTELTKRYGVKWGNAPAGN